jgi:cytochrome c5
VTAKSLEELIMTQRRLSVMPALLMILGGALARAGMPSAAQSPPAARAPRPQTALHWHKVSVTLPVSTTLFPAGEGADAANSQCLLCHSAGMVLSQPVRTEAQWKETINKMRNVYGAPLPAEQVDALAAYFARVLAHERALPGSSKDW